MKGIKITVNGKVSAVEDSKTVREYLEKAGFKKISRSVVVYNSKVLKSEEIGMIQIKNGDVLEVIEIVAGG